MYIISTISHFKHINNPTLSYLGDYESKHGYITWYNYFMTLFNDFTSNIANKTNALLKKALRGKQRVSKYQGNEKSKYEKSSQRPRLGHLQQLFPHYSWMLWNMQWWWGSFDT